MNENRLKKLTKKQRNELRFIFGNNDLLNQGGEIELFIKDVVVYLRKDIIEFVKNDGRHFNENITRSKESLSRIGYPEFWGDLKRINGDVYWKNKLLSDSAASYQKLKKHEVEIINAFIDAKGDAHAYILKIESEKLNRKRINLNSNPLFCSKSLTSIVDINWVGRLRNGTFKRKTKIRLRFNELKNNKVGVTIQVNEQNSISYKCIFEIGESLVVTLKTEFDNGKTLTCIIDAKNEKSRTSKLNIQLEYHTTNLNISKKSAFFNKDMVFLSLLGIICHISQTAKHYLTDKKKNSVYKEFIFYFDQISKHIVYKANSRANSQFENKVKLLTILPYPIYFAGLASFIGIGYFFGNNLPAYMSGALMALFYVVLSENYLLVEIFKSIYKIDDSMDDAKKDVVKLYLVVLLLLSLPTIVFAGLFYLMRKKVNLNYRVGFFRARSNVLVQRILRFGVDSMPWIHLARKVWLYENVSGVLSQLMAGYKEGEPKPIAVNIGSRLDWLFPFLSKNQSFKNVTFGEADFKSIISLKRYLLDAERLFLNENFEPRLDYFPLNIMEKGIEPIIDFYGLNEMPGNGSHPPLILLHEAIMCYTHQETILNVFKQLKKCRQPIIIIGDWEICMSDYNHYPEEDSGLFRLFRCLRQNRNLQEEDDDVSKEKYKGKFKSQEFKDLIHKYHFDVIEPSNGDMFANSEDKLAKDLITTYYHRNRMNPFTFFNRLNYKRKQRAESDSLIKRDMGYLMILANEEGKLLLSKNG